jgi:hypothetical protein
MSAPVATLGKVAGPPSGVECRVWQRYPCDAEASCQPVAARNDRDLHWPAVFKDLSVKGVGLVLGRRFEPGAGLAIELPDTDSQPGDTLLVRVVRVQAQPGGRWLHGCTLISELSQDELESLLSRGRAKAAPPPAAPVSRQHIIPNVVLELAGKSAAPYHARRLFLKGSWPIKPGTILHVRRGDAPAGSAWVRLRVQGCEQRQEQWTIRCVLFN